jgi:hypothetical protein
MKNKIKKIRTGVRRFVVCCPDVSVVVRLESTAAGETFAVY